MLYSVELPGRSMVPHTPRQSVRLPGSDSDRIQTYNLLIRSQMLYSVELPSHQADLPTSLVTAKVQYLDKFSKDSRQRPEGRMRVVTAYWSSAGSDRPTLLPVIGETIVGISWES